MSRVVSSRKCVSKRRVFSENVEIWFLNWIVGVLSLMAKSDHANISERHWRAPCESLLNGERKVGLQVDYNIWTGESQGRRESRDGVWRRMKGSYEYSMGRNTLDPIAGKPDEVWTWCLERRSWDWSLVGTSPRIYPWGNYRLIMSFLLIDISRELELDSGVALAVARRNKKRAIEQEWQEPWREFDW